MRHGEHTPAGTFLRGDDAIDPSTSNINPHDSADAPPRRPHVRTIGLEAAFDRFAASLRSDAIARGDSGKARQRTGPPPSITVEQISRHVVNVLDAEGPDAVTVRRIAEDLRISTRTLYKRIQSREKMVRYALATHYATLDLTFDAHQDWKRFVTQWCVALHRELVRHPHLTDLTAGREIVCRQRYFDELVAAARRGTVPDPVSCCERLVDLTMGDAFMRVRTICKADDGGTARYSLSERVSDDLESLVEIVVAGMSESGLAGQRRCTVFDGARVKI